MLRTLFALLAGLFSMTIVITFVQLANARLFYPPPAGMDWADPDAVAAFASSLPVAAMALVVAGWLAGAFAGSFTATRIDSLRRLACGIPIGIVVVAGVIQSAMTIPHPTWVIAAGTLLPVPVAWLGARLAQKGLASTR